MYLESDGFANQVCSIISYVQGLEIPTKLMEELIIFMTKQVQDTAVYTSRIACKAMQDAALKEIGLK